MNTSLFSKATCLLLISLSLSSCLHFEWSNTFLSNVLFEEREFLNQMLETEWQKHNLPQNLALDFKQATTQPAANNAKNSIELIIPGEVTTDPSEKFVTTIRISIVPGVEEDLFENQIYTQVSVTGLSDSSLSHAVQRTIDTWAKMLTDWPHKHIADGPDGLFLL